MTVSQRLRAQLLWGLVRTLQRLPDRHVHRVAHALGAGLYLAQPRRRALVRANLERVCRWLADEGLASGRVAAAAHDPRRLDALVRDAFGHYVRAYAESAIVPAYPPKRLLERLRLDSPGATAELLGPPPGAGRGRVVVGMHFGAVELGARYAVVHGSSPVTGPMETIDDPVLESVILRARAGTGVRLLGLGTAASDLAGALARGETVAIVADRTVRGAGVRVSLFGAPARLPVGPAILALRSGAPAYVVAVRRVGWGDYAGRVMRIDVPADGPRRRRVASFLDAEARLFERCIADAPEQWWTLFFRIWEERAHEERPRVEEAA